MTPKRWLLLSLILLAVVGMSGCAVPNSQIVSEIAVTVTGLLPLLGLIPGAGPAVSLVTASLQVVETLLNEYKGGNTTLGAVTAAFDEVQANLGKLEVTAQVTDKAAQAKINAVILAATTTLHNLERNLVGEGIKSGVVPVPTAPVPPS